MNDDIRKVYAQRILNRLSNAGVTITTVYSSPSITERECTKQLVNEIQSVLNLNKKKPVRIGTVNPPVAKPPLDFRNSSREAPRSTKVFVLAPQTAKKQKIDLGIKPRGNYVKSAFLSTKGADDDIEDEDGNDKDEIKTKNEDDDDEIEEHD
jgi:hypothetical protein